MNSINRRCGVTLIEIIVALTIFLIGAAGVIGLMNAGGASNARAMDDDAASDLLETLNSEIRARALRGETAPREWASEPQTHPDHARLLFRASMTPVGGSRAESAARKASAPLTYAVRIEIGGQEVFDALADRETLPGQRVPAIYETLVVVRHDAGPRR